MTGFPIAPGELVDVDWLNAIGSRKIAETIISGSAVASIDFSSIPDDYAHLMVVLYLRGTAAANFSSLIGRVNADSGSHYDSQTQTANNTTLNGSGAAAGSSGTMGRIPAGTAPTNAFGAGLILIPCYAAGVGHKPWLSWSVDREVSGVAGDNVLGSQGGIWLSTSAITELTLLPNSGSIDVGSMATLYGLA
jgi:hypothetical protein